MRETITPTAAGPDLFNESPPLSFFSAIVRGIDSNGEEFEESVPLDGHLDGDLYLRLAQRMEPYSTLFVVIRAAPEFESGPPALRVALHGRVGRVNTLPDGKYEVRLTVQGYQVL